VEDSYGRLIINRSTLSNNAGTGVRSNRGDIRLTNSTVSDNSAIGVWMKGSSVERGTLTLINSTISGNSSHGIEGEVSYITAINSTVTGNDYDGVGGFIGSHITLVRTLISGNGETTTGVEVYSDSLSTCTAGNFNLFGNGGNAQVVRCSPGATDIVPS
jgi:hypothetical protein